MIARPSFGSQTYVRYTLRKIRQVRQMVSGCDPAREINGGVAVEVIGVIGQRPGFAR